MDVPSDVREKIVKKMCWVYADVDECSSEGMSACDPVSTECVNVPGGYFCRCRHGFRPNGTSSLATVATGRPPPPAWSCVDANECSGWAGGHRCPAGTVCRNTVGSYDCVCDVDARRCRQATSKYRLKLD